MDTTISIIIGIFTAALSTYLAYLAQSRRDAHILWKNRSRFLYKLLQESFKLAKLEFEHLNAWSTSLKHDVYDFPLLKQASGTKVTFEILAEKAMLDEYYFAYTKLFKNYVKAEEMFYALQTASLHLKAIYDQSLKMIEDSQQRNHQRQTEILDIYNQSVEWINAQIQTSNGEELPFLQKFRFIHKGYLEVKGGSQSANLPVMFEQYFYVIGNTINSSSIPNSLIPYGALINKFFPIYHGIGFQNNNLTRDIDDNIKAFNDAIVILGKIIKYWNENFTYHLDN